MVKLSNADKQNVAIILISAAANLLEADWDCGYYDEIRHLSTDEGRAAVAQQLADWLGRLPGERWDVRLPDPTYTK